MRSPVLSFRLVAATTAGVALCGCVQQPPPKLPLEPRAEVRPRAAPAPVAWSEIGRSVEGRPIRCRRSGTGARRVLWIGGIHGDEIEGCAATDELPDAFLAAPGLPAAVTLHVVEDMNPDGRAARTRGNRRGVDLNRDFPASNRRSDAGLSQPESRAIHDLICRLEPDLVLIAHSWRGDHFVNYDGPCRSLAERFRGLSGFRVVPSSNIAATPGSIGSWCGWDCSIPILTIEWERGTPPADAWVATREAILAVIRGG